MSVAAKCYCFLCEAGGAMLVSATKLLQLRLRHCRRWMCPRHGKKLRLFTELFTVLLYPSALNGEN